MKVSWPVMIAGTGIGVPEQVVTNADFAARLDTSDEWIVQRTGIRERRLASPGESTLQFATDAARGAIADAGLEPSDIDLIINATVTPEHTLPSTACELQAALGCEGVQAFDINAACSGFTYGFQLASQAICAGSAKNAVVIGTETMSSIMDMEDRAVCVLFGDGAGAAIVSRCDDAERGVKAVRMGADGNGCRLIWTPAGGSAEPASAKTVAEKLHFMRMNGREVYKFAVTMFQKVLAQTLEDAGITVDDLALVIPHQSNIRIIESGCQKLGLPIERVMVNIDRYGNTSAASVPIALHEAHAAGRIHPGDYVLLISFGAGLTWGSILLRA